MISGGKVQPKPFEVLLDQNQISERITELGRQISVDYEDKQPVLVGVLKGCVVFLADLIRQITVPLELEFVLASSYRQGAWQETDVKIGGEFSIDLKARHVLLVEGIVDTGKTASLILDKINRMEPASVEIVSLLDKPASHRQKLKIKYKGFSIGNEFAIGFGLDNTQQFRHLPFVGRMVDS